MTGRYRVVFVDHCAELSGGEIALARMIEALGDDVDAHVLLGEDGPLVGRLERLGASVEILPMARRILTLNRRDATSSVRSLATLRDLTVYVAHLSKRLRALQPDVVHTNSLKAALYGGTAARLAGRPVIWHVRDRIAPDYLPRPAVRLVRALSRILPTTVLVNSHDTASTLPGPTTVMYDVVNFDAPSPAPSTEGRPLVIGLVGRLAPWKGQDVFLEAFARLAEGRDVVARIIGSAMFGEEEFEALLRQRVAALGLEHLVEFRGFRDDIAQEYAELDIVVHASTIREPFGQVVIEAMASGRPIIAAAAGGPLEVVSHGVNGLLVPPGDVDGYHAALVRLCEDPALRELLAAGGLARSQDFRPQAVADRVLDLYGRLSDD